MKVILANSSEIKRWMQLNGERFTDPKTGELDCTSMVEAWDREVSDGKSTLDPLHPAWDLAAEVAAEEDEARGIRDQLRSYYSSEGKS